MRRELGAALLVVLTAVPTAEAQAIVLRDRLVPGSRLRYGIRVQYETRVEHNRRLGFRGSTQDLQRKYEVTGVLSLEVAEAAADGSTRLEGRFEQLQLSQWFWGDDRPEAERMVQALRQQRITVTRDAQGNLNTVPAQRIPLERFRPDIETLERMAAIPLLDFSTEGVAPGMRWQREIPPERYRYSGQNSSGTAATSYEYLGNRTVGERACALLATEGALPVRAWATEAEVRQLAQQGLTVRTTGGQQVEFLELVDIERGLLLALDARATGSFRATIRNEREDLQVKVPLPLVTARFTVAQEVRWLGPGEAALVSAVAGLPALAGLRSPGRAGQASAPAPSLGEIAREMRAQREQVSPTTVQAAPAPRRPADERELRHFPIDGEVATRSDWVRFDTGASVDGNGSLAVTALKPMVVPLFVADNLQVENAELVYQAWLRTQDIAGQVYLEMWCEFEGVGEFFSRGFAQALTGTHSWVRVETPFLLERGQRPKRVRLNLVVNGRGRVWIDDIRLLARPLR